MFYFAIFSNFIKARMVLVDNFLDFLELNLFAYLLLHLTLCTMWRLYFTFLSCYQHLEIFSEI